MKILIPLAGLIGVGLIFSCSHPIDDAKVTLSVRSAADREALARLSQNRLRYSAPGSVSGFDCVLLTVSAADIPATYGEDVLGTPCTSQVLGLGSTSTLLSMTEFLRGDTDLFVRTRRGTGRVVKLLGIDTAANDGTCSATAIPELFTSSTRPFIFEISRTTTDIGHDITVDLSNLYQNTTSSSPTDLVDSCRPREERRVEASFAYQGMFVTTPSPAELFNFSNANFGDSLTQNPTGTSILPPVYDPSNITRMDEFSSVARVYARYNGSGSVETRARVDLIFNLAGIQLSLYEKWIFRVEMGSGAVTSVPNCDGSYSEDAHGYVAAVWTGSSWRTNRMLLDVGSGLLDTQTSTDQLESPSAVRITEDGGSAAQSSYIHISLRSRKEESGTSCAALDIRSAQIFLKP